MGLLRYLGRRDAAIAAANDSLSKDKLEYGALWEKQLLTNSPLFTEIVCPNNDILIELAIDYAHAGLFGDAAALLDSATSSQPMLKYTLGWIYEQAGEIDKAFEAFQDAVSLASDYCFPNRLEDVLSLTTAMRLNKDDARAPYYLGNFWYSHRRYAEAIAAWEKACALDDRFPTVQRNLGLAYYNKLGESERAVQSLETSIKDWLCRSSDKRPKQTRSSRNWSIMAVSI